MAVMSALPDPEYHAEMYRDIPTKRLLAWVVDSLVIALLTAVLVPLTFFTALFYIPLLVVIVSFLYRWWSLAANSATPGMRFMAVELRNGSGERLSNAEALLHTAGYQLSITIVPLQLISIVLMLVSARKQGLTDHVLDTAMLNRQAGF